MNKWTILVFMAADNDLDRYAVKDIHEMERLGSNSDLSLVVQIDRRGGGPEGTARRGLITKNENWEKYSPIVTSSLEDIGETNTGDPAVLADFIIWGIANFPAQHYGLVIWNHGSGWKPEFLYEAASKTAGNEISSAMRGADFASRFNTQTRRIIFRTTLENRVGSFIKGSLVPQLEFRNLSLLDLKGDSESADLFLDVLNRAIALDETSSHDALDSIELENAIDAARNKVSEIGIEFERFEIIGFDACLMAGIEVAYQIKRFSKYIVGSEDIEPGVGWRYDLLIERIPWGSVSAEDAAVRLVDNYIDGLSNYQIRLITQSAINCEGLSNLAETLADTTRKLVGLLGTKYVALAKAEKTSTRYYDTDFLDIGDYLSHLAMINDESSLAESVLLTQNAYNACVVSSRFSFNKPSQTPSGISIYYPTKPLYDVAYGELSIVEVLNDWSMFIKQYHFL